MWTEGGTFNHIYFDHFFCVYSRLVWINFEFPSQNICPFINKKKLVLKKLICRLQGKKKMTFFIFENATFLFKEVKIVLNIKKYVCKSQKILFVNGFTSTIDDFLYLWKKIYDCAIYWVILPTRMFSVIPPLYFVECGHVYFCVLIKKQI